MDSLVVEERRGQCDSLVLLRNRKVLARLTRWNGPTLLVNFVKTSALFAFISLIVLSHLQRSNMFNNSTLRRPRGNHPVRLIHFAPQSMSCLVSILVFVKFKSDRQSNCHESKTLFVVELLPIKNLFFDFLCFVKC